LVFKENKGVVKGLIIGYYIKKESVNGSLPPAKYVSFALCHAKNSFNILPCKIFFLGLPLECIFFFASFSYQYIIIHGSIALYIERVKL
jgi:hypothetical protein